MKYFVFEKLSANHCTYHDAQSDVTVSLVLTPMWSLSRRVEGGCFKLVLLLEHKDVETLGSSIVIAGPMCEILDGLFQLALSRMASRIKELQLLNGGKKGGFYRIAAPLLKQSDLLTEMGASPCALPRAFALKINDPKKLLQFSGENISEFDQSEQSEFIWPWLEGEPELDALIERPAHMVHAKVQYATLAALSWKKARSETGLIGSEEQNFQLLTKRLGFFQSPSDWVESLRGANRV